jgi:circadian clock protein KaiB
LTDDVLKESTPTVEFGANMPARQGLRLYVAGSTPRSLSAVRNIKRICESRLSGGYDLEVVDVYKQPNRAVQDNIIAIPTLVRYSPGGAKRLIGDLSQKLRVERELGLLAPAT